MIMSAVWCLLMELWNHLFSKYPFICSCYFLCYYTKSDSDYFKVLQVQNENCFFQTKTVWPPYLQAFENTFVAWISFRPSLALIDRLVSSSFSTVGKLLALLNAIHSSGLIFLHSFRYNTFKKNRKLSNSEIINV